MNEQPNVYQVTAHLKLDQNPKPETVNALAKMILHAAKLHRSTEEPKMGTLDRGFKSWAERTAATLRRELELGPLAPIDPLRVASFLAVDMRTPKAGAVCKESAARVAELAPQAVGRKGQN